MSRPERKRFREWMRKKVPPQGYACEIPKSGKAVIAEAIRRVEQMNKNEKTA